MLAQLRMTLFQVQQLLTLWAVLQAMTHLSVGVATTRCKVAQVQTLPNTQVTKWVTKFKRVLLPGRLLLPTLIQPMAMMALIRFKALRVLVLRMHWAVSIQQ